MLSKKLEQSINDQINKEFYSEFLYLSMASYFKDLSLDGFANFFVVQAEEEHFHAMKFFNFVHEKGGKVALDTIEKPQIEFESTAEIFEIALKHEQYVTKRINDLMDLAIKENDHAVKGFLQWYVDEQVEEEASFDNLLRRVKLVGDNGNGIIQLDMQLAGRTFTPPAAE